MRERARLRSSSRSLVVALIVGAFDPFVAPSVAHAQVDVASVHRWYNPTNGDHFYSAQHANESLGGYNYEGVAFRLWTTSAPGRTLLFRWYNSTNGDHFYTTEAANEIQGYTSEGSVGFVYGSPRAGLMPLHRWYNPSNGDHFYTTDPASEINGYRSEGIACYVLAASASNGTQNSGGGNGSDPANANPTQGSAGSANTIAQGSTNRTAGSQGSQGSAGQGSPPSGNAAPGSDFGAGANAGENTQGNPNPANPNGGPRANTDRTAQAPNQTVDTTPSTYEGVVRIENNPAPGPLVEYNPVRVTIGVAGAPPAPPPPPLRLPSAESRCVLAGLSSCTASCYRPTCLQRWRIFNTNRQVLNYSEDQATAVSERQSNSRAAYEQCLRTCNPPPRSRCPAGRVCAAQAL